MKHTALNLELCYPYQPIASKGWVFIQEPLTNSNPFK